MDAQESMRREAAELLSSFKDPPARVGSASPPSTSNTSHPSPHSSSHTPETHTLLAPTADSTASSNPSSSSPSSSLNPPAPSSPSNALEPPPSMPPPPSGSLAALQQAMLAQMPGAPSSCQLHPHRAPASPAYASLPPTPTAITAHSPLYSPSQPSFFFPPHPAPLPGSAHASHGLDTSSPLPPSPHHPFAHPAFPPHMFFGGGAPVSSSAVTTTATSIASTSAPSPYFDPSQQYLMAQAAAAAAAFSAPCSSVSNAPPPSSSSAPTPAVSMAPPGVPPHMLLQAMMHQQQQQQYLMQFQQHQLLLQQQQQQQAGAAMAANPSLLGMSPHALSQLSYQHIMALVAQGAIPPFHPLVAAAAAAAAAAGGMMPGHPLMYPGAAAAAAAALGQMQSRGLGAGDDGVVPLGKGDSFLVRTYKRARPDSSCAEGEAAADAERRKRAAVAIMPLPSSALAECVAQYLENPAQWVQHVRIVHPQVAQRSYGHEKRYLCPPPMMLLHGARWREELLAGIVPRLRVTCDTNTTELPLGGEDERLGLHTVCKSLFITDNGASRPGHADLTFDVIVNEDRTVGSFSSGAIAVISKPIKKIRVDRPDMCIKARSPIALFNRVRGQTVSTRYLSVDGTGAARCGLTINTWSCFELVPEEGEQPLSVEKQLNPKSALLCHRQTFCLKDTLTGTLTPPLVLQKVDKNMVVLDCDEPVSQLGRVALLVPSADNQYLSVVDGVVSLHKAMPHPENSKRAIIMEGAAWTISSTKTMHYSYADMRRPRSGAAGIVEPAPVCNAPVISGASVLVRNGEPTVELRGEDLDSSLACFFGAHRLAPATAASSLIMHFAILKDVWELGGKEEKKESAEEEDEEDEDEDAVREEKKKDVLPLLLVRGDGVLFPCAHAFCPTRRTMVEHVLQ